MFGRRLSGGTGTVSVVTISKMSGCAFSRSIAFP
jgi:hypothetical protein